MSFFAPGILWALPLLIVPALVHLLSRRRRRLVDFPALELFRQAVERRSERSRLRDRLLLLARTLILAFAVLAAARPHWAAGPGPGLQVVALDRSASMGYRPAASGGPWEQGLAGARHLARGSDELQPRALICFDRAGIERIVQPTAAAETMLDGLAGLQPTARAGLRQPWRRLLGAADSLRSAGGGVELVVLSDFRGPNWFEGEPLAAEGLRLVLVPLAGGDAPNRGVTELQTRRRDPERIDVQVQVAAWGGAPLPTEVNFFVAGTALHSLQLEGEHGSFTAACAAAGELRALIHGDALTVDDQRFAVIPAWQPLEIWIVGSGRKEGASDDWIARMLDPDDAGRVRRLSSAELGAALTGEEPDVVVLADVDRVDPAVVEALTLRVRGGGGLWCLLGGQADLQSWEHSGLANLLGGSAWGHLGGASALRLAEPDAAHPILLPFTARELRSLAATPLHQALAMETKEETMLTLESGEPLFWTRGLERGRLALMATALDLEWGGWPARAGTVALVHQTVRYLAGNTLAAEQLTLGEPCFSPIAPPGVLTVALETPRGDSLRVPAGGTQLAAHHLQEVGLHRWRVADQALAFAVNPAPEVGDLRAAPVAAWAQQWDAQLLTPEILREVGSAPPGRSLVPWILVALLLALSAEAWLRWPRASAAEGYDKLPGHRRGAGRRTVQ